MNKSRYNVSVTFAAPRLDKVTLEKLLKCELDASDIHIVAEFAGSNGGTRNDGGPPVLRLSSVLEGVEALRTFASENKVFRWRQIRHLPSAHSSIRYLLGSGELQKVKHGIYALAGTEDIAKRIRNLGGYQTKLGKRQQAIYDALAEPMTAGELRRLGGVSRQAVDQTLKKLLKAGLIRRQQTLGEQCEWLYVHAGASLVAATLNRVPTLSEIQRRVLNLLPPAGPVALKDIREIVPSYPSAIERLVLKRLVERGGGPKKHVVRLTRAGLDHPAYEPGGEHLRTCDEPGLMQPEQLRLLLALDALGQARALELTAAAAIKPIGRVGTGQYLQRLNVCGYIEQIRPRADRAPVYRLTRNGAALVALAKQAGSGIDPTQARAAIAEAAARRAQHAARLNALRSGRNPGELSERSKDILATLAQHDRLTTAEIGLRMQRPFQNPKSINLALKQLSDEGLLGVTRRGKANVFTLSDAGREKLSQKASFTR